MRKKSYYLKNKEKCLKMTKAARERNKEKYKMSAHANYEKRRDYYLKYKKLHYLANVDEYLINAMCHYYGIHREHISAKIVEILKNRIILKRQLKSIQNETLSNS